MGVRREVSGYITALFHLQNEGTTTTSGFSGVSLPVCERRD